jgi:hypothetical protein
LEQEVLRHVRLDQTKITYEVFRMTITDQIRDAKADELLRRRLRAAPMMRSADRELAVVVVDPEVVVAFVS